MVRFGLAAAALWCLSAGDPAVAVVRTNSYSFVAAGFVTIGNPGPPPPFATVTGSFRLTFDDAVPVGDATAGLRNPAISIPVSSPIGYQYFGDGLLLLGGLASGANIINGFTDDFDLLIEAADTAAPRLDYLVYENLAAPGVFYSSTANAIIASPAPEPVTWVLLAAGSAVTGTALRRRRFAMSGAA